MTTPEDALPKNVLFENVMLSIVATEGTTRTDKVAVGLAPYARQGTSATAKELFFDHMEKLMDNDRPP